MPNPIKILGIKITSIITKGSRFVKVEYVDKTDLWTRAFLSNLIQKSFSDVVEKNIDLLASDVDTVALQETPHESKKDHRTHWTVVEINGSKQVIKKRHLVVE